MVAVISDTPSISARTCAMVRAAQTQQAQATAAVENSLTPEMRANIVADLVMQKATRKFNAKSIDITEWQEAQISTGKLRSAKSIAEPKNVADAMQKYAIVEADISAAVASCLSKG